MLYSEAEVHLFVNNVLKIQKKINIKYYKKYKQQRWLILVLQEYLLPIINIDYKSNSIKKKKDQHFPFPFGNVRAIENIKFVGWKCQISLLFTWGNRIHSCLFLVTKRLSHAECQREQIPFSVSCSQDLFPHGILQSISLQFLQLRKKKLQVPVQSQMIQIFLTVPKFRLTSFNSLPFCTSSSGQLASRSVDKRQEVLQGNCSQFLPEELKSLKAPLRTHQA